MNVEAVIRSIEDALNESDVLVRDLPGRAALVNKLLWIVEEEVRKSKLPDPCGYCGYHHPGGDCYDS